jgi:hypothetical protein
MVSPAQAIPQTLIDPGRVDGCPGCPGVRIMLAVRLDRVTAAAVTAAVASGLAGLIAAGRAVDPVVQRRLHAAAVASVDRASLLANHPIASATDWDDGDLCPPWPWPGPPPPGWLDAERHLAEGITLLSQAALTTDPGRAASLHNRAVINLDSSVTDLLTFQRCA